VRASTEYLARKCFAWCPKTQNVLLHCCLWIAAGYQYVWEGDVWRGDIVESNRNSSSVTTVRIVTDTTASVVQKCRVCEKDGLAVVNIQYGLCEIPVEGVGQQLRSLQFASVVATGINDSEGSNVKVHSYLQSSI